MLCWLRVGRMWWEWGRSEGGPDTRRPPTSSPRIAVPNVGLFSAQYQLIPPPTFLHLSCPFLFASPCSSRYHFLPFRSSLPVFCFVTALLLC